MCFEYDDYPEFSSSRVVKARKQHRCYVCGGIILVGEIHQTHTQKYDGVVSTSRVCRRCEYDIVRIVENELAEGCKWHEAWPSLGDVSEHLELSGLGRTPFDRVPESFKVGDQPKKPAKGGA